MSTLNPCIVAAVILGSLVSVSVPVHAQKNATLIKQWKRSGAPGFNDCWGWTSPDYREFAFVGQFNGMWVVETTGGVVKESAFYRLPQNRSTIWRDFTNYNQYIYSVSEGRRGIEIIDMSNPSSPKHLGNVQSSVVTRTHNISVDPDTGFLYLTGVGSRTLIFDAKSNPTNPKFIATWSVQYAHDACIRRGFAYFANGTTRGNNVVRIVDVSNVTRTRTVGQCKTPGNYAHNAWVSEDDKLLVCTDEISRTTVSPHMSIWDISNKSAPVKKGDYVFGTGSVGVHNAFVIGRTAIMSYYLHGLQVVDLADPTKPVMIANWDTSTRTSGYNGCWGCYPFADSGLIYGSDLDNGLFVVQIDCGHMNRYGKPTLGSNGKAPRARFDGASPKVGASGLRIEVENLLPNARFVLLVGSKRGSGKLLGIDVHVDLATALLVHAKADSKGRASLPAPVPNSPGIGGAKIYLQIASADGGKPGGFSASRGMWTGICK